VYISVGGEYKIGNFSKAKLVTEGTQIASLAGEYNFRSPEMKKDTTLQKVLYDPHKSDVFSLGMVLLAMARLQSFSTIGEVNIKQVPGLIQDLPYSEELKSKLSLMLQEDPAARPDFLQLRDVLKEKSKLDDIVAELQGQLTQSTEASALLASRLEDLWTVALLRKWGKVKQRDFRSAQFYLRKLELEEVLAKLGAYEAIAKLRMYVFPFIHISDFVTEEANLQAATLIIERKTVDHDYEPIHRINSPCGLYEYYRDGTIVLFTVRKEYNLVTIAEPATPRPIVLVRMPSGQPIQLSKLQQYRMGDCLLSIVELSPAQITIQCRIVDTTTPFLTLPLDAASAPFLIGRSQLCSIRLQQLAVSSRHAELRVHEGAWVLVDLNSKNGTLLYCHKDAAGDMESDEVKLENEQVANYQNEYFRFRVVYP